MGPAHAGNVCAGDLLVSLSLDRVRYTSLCFCGSAASSLLADRGPLKRNFGCAPSPVAAPTGHAQHLLGGRALASCAALHCGRFQLACTHTHVPRAAASEAAFIFMQPGLPLAIPCFFFVRLRYILSFVYFILPSSDCDGRLTDQKHHSPHPRSRVSRLGLIRSDLICLLVVQAAGLGSDSNTAFQSLKQHLHDNGPSSSLRHTSRL